MEIVLTEDVVGLGDIGEIVRVRPGYARNFLIPKGVALETGAISAAGLKHRMLQIEAKKKRLQSLAETEAQKIRDASIELVLRVGRSGKVFGSITSNDISKALTDSGYEIDRRRIQLSSPIKSLGTHFITVKLHPEVTAQLKVTISAAEATKEEEAQETANFVEAIEERTSEEVSGEEEAFEGEEAEDSEG